jgi:hypothetical protein
MFESQLGQDAAMCTVEELLGVTNIRRVEAKDLIRSRLTNSSGYGI